jgi:manganese transport protein
MQHFKQRIQSYLPGFFLICYNIGIGSVTLMSKSGALYGCSLLWVVIMSSLLYYYFVCGFSRYTMVTGETFIWAVKRHIGRPMAWLILTFVWIIILPAILGLMGIMSEVLFEWSKGWIAGGISSAIWAIGLSLLICLFFIMGTTGSVKQVLSSIVIIIVVAFIANLFYAFPPIGDVVKGLVPSIPPDVAGSDNGTNLLIAGMIGTTVSSIAFMIRSINVKEEGWGVEQLKQQKHDALLSTIGVFVISTAILIAAASTLHPRGLRVNNAVDLVRLLEPIAGSTSIILMVIGIIAAGITSHIPNVMVIPWAMSDYEGKPMDLQCKRNRILVVCLTMLGIITPVFHWKPVFVMLLSQGMLTILLPIIVACLWYLLNRKDMKAYKFKHWENILMGFVFCVSLFFSGIAIWGLVKDYI